MNIKSVAARRENMLWFKTPHKIYFKRGCLDGALAELRGHKRAFIITDKTMTQIGITGRICDILEANGMSHQVFDAVKPDPDLSTIDAALEQVRPFDPDIFIAVGGGSPMDAAKIVWLMYEHPEIPFDDIAMRFMDIRKRIVTFPELGRKAKMVAIPTTSGTGSEVTPFTVITDDKTGRKYPIADYEILSDMAIVDPDLAMSMPPKLTAFSGIDVLTHAIESYTSILASNMSDGHAVEAARLVLKYLRRSYDAGAGDPVAREKMHYAATIAGMAFANAFLGLCHSMAHKFGARFHVPHGLANAVLLPYVMKYNATDAPTKQGLFPQYRYPFIKGRYARLADTLGLTAGIAPDDIEGKVNRLVGAVQDLKAGIGIPFSIKELGMVDEKTFLKGLDELSEEAFDDQCTGSNARYPLIPEIKEIYLAAYYGKPLYPGEKRRKPKK